MVLDMAFNATLRPVEPDDTFSLINNTLARTWSRWALRSVPELGGDTVTLVVDPYKLPNKLLTLMRDPKEEVRLW